MDVAHAVNLRELGHHEPLDAGNVAGDYID
jgi:hypothetical protein